MILPKNLAILYQAFILSPPLVVRSFLSEGDLFCDRMEKELIHKYNPMQRENQILGAEGEKIAENFLREKGYRILSRNWKCKLGELDIVALKQKGKIFKKPEAIVFVEVKTIDSADVEFEGQPEENVNYFKQRHLIKSAQCYLKANKISPKIPWQIDVIAIEFNQVSGSHKIRHHEKAVWQ